MHLSEDQLKLRQTMPRLHGYVLSLFYVPEKQLAGYESEWRTWCVEHKAEKHLWPAWIELWAQKRKKDRA